MKLVALVLALAACVAPASARANATTRVPFQLANDHVFVDVALDGTGPYHFVVDSGSPFALLDAAVASELHLAVRPYGTIGGVGDREARAGVATARVARIGDLALARERFVVTDLHGTIGTAEGRPVDGVLGRDLFERFTTTFDYAHRTLVFGDDARALVRGGATVVPMRVDSGVPRVACRIDGFRATCNIDTGSRLALTVTAPFSAAHPGLLPASLSEIGVDGFGLGGAAFGRFGRVRLLAIGDAIVRDVLCDFSTQARGAFADARLGGNVGGGVLKRFAVTFDSPDVGSSYARIPSPHRATASTDPASSS